MRLIGETDVATVFREIERKYDAGRAAAAALDAVKSMTGVAGVAAVSQQDEEILDAIYYDTEDLRLIRAGVTLRQRTGGEDAGWHLKLPVGADTRDEIRLPLAAPAGKGAGKPPAASTAKPPTAKPPTAKPSSAKASRAGSASRRVAGPAGKAVSRRDGSATDAVPGELTALVRALTRDADLVPVVRMLTIRDVFWLLDGAGTVLAEISADHVSAELTNGSTATTWDEMEVELRAGDRRLLQAIDVRLRAAGARPAPTGTKLERALGDRLRAAQRPAGDAASPTASAGPARLTPRSPAGDVVLAYVRQQVSAITHNDPLVRRDEPDAVHQMRVATRRARSALQAFGEIIDKARTRPLCDELKWLAAVLGEARDAEVLLDRFTGDLAGIPAELITGPVQTRITEHFASVQKQARVAATRALDGKRYLTLLNDLDALVADPPLTPLAAGKAGKALGKPVRRAERRLRRALAVVPAAQDKDAAIHEARKAAKRARYAAEAAMPALGSKARRQAKRTKRLQGLLGDHHDSVVARTVLLGLVDQARVAGEDTFTYGVMYERLACAAGQIERMLPDAQAGAKK
jgi:CHAD domain-containing protein